MYDLPFSFSPKRWFKLKMCFKMGHARHHFSFILIFSTVNTRWIFCTKFCWRLDSNLIPLVWEATALPTEPRSNQWQAFYLSFYSRNLQNGPGRARSRNFQNVWTRKTSAGRVHQGPLPRYPSWAHVSSLV